MLFALRSVQTRAVFLFLQKCVALRVRFNTEVFCFSSFLPAVSYRLSFISFPPKEMVLTYFSNTDGAYFCLDTREKEESFFYFHHNTTSWRKREICES